MLQLFSAAKAELVNTHAKKTQGVENANAMNRVIAGEVLFPECKVDSRRNLQDEQKHLRKDAAADGPFCFGMSNADVRDMNVLLPFDNVVLDSEVDRCNGG